MEGSQSGHTIASAKSSITEKNTSFFKTSLWLSNCSGSHWIPPICHVGSNKTNWNIIPNTVWLRSTTEEDQLFLRHLSASRLWGLEWTEWHFKPTTCFFFLFSWLIKMNFNSSLCAHYLCTEVWVEVTPEGGKSFSRSPPANNNNNNTHKKVK